MVAMQSGADTFGKRYKHEKKPATLTATGPASNGARGLVSSRRVFTFLVVTTAHGSWP